MTRRELFVAITGKASPMTKGLNDKELSEEVQNCLEIGDGVVHPGKFDINLIPEERLDDLLGQLEKNYPSWICAAWEEYRNTQRADDDY